MDFPSNSAKSRFGDGKKPEKNVTKVVTMEVTTRKRPLGARFKDVFIGGESKAALRYVGYEVLLPALRNMIVDTTTKGIERVIYGDAAPRREYGSNTRIAYNSPVSRYGHRPGYSQSPLNRPTPSRSRNAEIELLFGSREEAERVLEMMAEIVDTWEFASVADLHELSGLPSVHTDQKWGWSNLTSASVRQIREGFVIDFPPVQPA